MLSDSSIGSQDSDSSQMSSDDDGGQIQRSDSKSSQIKAIEKLVEKGIIKKEAVVEIIKTILLQPSPLPLKAPKARSRGVKQNFIDLTEKNVTKTLKSKKFRRSASPETVLVRDCISESIERRYRHEVARKDSKMFTQTPPRRLKEGMFEGSVRDPLKEVYTKYAEELKDVAGGKILKIIKWKIRKMRSNPLPAKSSVAKSNFDFDALAMKLERNELKNQSFLQRRSSFYNSSKTSPPTKTATDTNARRRRRRSPPRRHKQPPRTPSPPSSPSSGGSTTPIEPSPIRGLDHYKKCCECGVSVCCVQPFTAKPIAEVAHPTDINWLVSSASAYCQKHYNEKLAKMNSLALEKGHSQRKPKRRNDKVLACLYVIPSSLSPSSTFTD